MENWQTANGNIERNMETWGVMVAEISKKWYNQ